MTELIDLEKKINSELATKIKSSDIKHNHLYLNMYVSLGDIHHYPKKLKIFWSKRLFCGACCGLSTLRFLRLSPTFT